MDSKISKNLLKIRQIDETDKRILGILLDNARVKLTGLAKEIGLSVDSTKKRLQKLERDKIIFKYTVQLDPEKLGRPLAAHVYIKLKDLVKEKYDEFLKELTKNRRVIVLMGMLGDYDLYVVFLAKDTVEMDEIKMEIRQRFGSIIGEWKEVVVSKVYLLEDFRF